VENLVAGHNMTLRVGPSSIKQRTSGLRVLLDTLEQCPGATWHDRWHASGIETAQDWRKAAGAVGSAARSGIAPVLHALLCHRLIRPGYPWLLGQGFVALTTAMSTTTDRADFDRVRRVAVELNVAASSAISAIHLIACVLVHTGKKLDQLTSSDLMDYSAARRSAGRAHTAYGLHTAHKLLREMGLIAEHQRLPGNSRPRAGRLSPSQLVERRNLRCVPIRDLLIDYLTERATELDHASLRTTEGELIACFWADLERHHPGIDSLALTPKMIRDWKARIQTLSNGAPRRNVPKIYLTVRSFYLDLAQWAAEDPQRWTRWVAPSPITAADMRQMGKIKKHTRARIHDRIRSLVPFLPAIRTHVRDHLNAAGALLAAAAECEQGAEFTHAGQRFERRGRTSGRVSSSPAVVIRKLDHDDRRWRNLTHESDDAFWTWAVVEILSLSGIRLEELTELTHLSIRQHRMGGDGQVVILLQIAPSKTDRERVIPVCPELAHALAQVVARARGGRERIPLIARYDREEKETSEPLPFLLQRQRFGDQQLLSPVSVGRLLNCACQRMDLRHADGSLVRFTPHDFRRVFATEAVNGGLPIHIAAKLLGHLNLNTTQGYVAVYPEQVIRQTQAHLARRRALRSGEEYRPPTDAEWADFEQHFRRRRLALGDCYRPYGTDCAHEHACIRCPMMRMDPNELPRLRQIEADTHRLLAEARTKGWDGEVSALETTLLHIAEKAQQVERLRTAGQPVLIELTRLSPTP
jgi:integrase